MELEKQDSLPVSEEPSVENKEETFVISKSDYQAMMDRINALENREKQLQSVDSTFNDALERHKADQEYVNTRMTIEQKREYKIKEVAALVDQLNLLLSRDDYPHHYFSSLQTRPAIELTRRLSVHAFRMGGEKFAREFLKSFAERGYNSY